MGQRRCHPVQLSKSVLCNYWTILKSVHEEENIYIYIYIYIYMSWWINRQTQINIGSADIQQNFDRR